MKMYIIELDGERKFAGEVRGKYFVTERKRSIHFFRKKGCWAMDTKLLYNLREKGVTIKIFEKEKRETFIITPDKWIQHGIEMNYGKHRPQILIEEEYFDRT